MVGQRCLLQYLIPWLKNVELADIAEEGFERMMTTQEETEDPSQIPENSRQLKPVPLVGEGWGSVHASQMVLNNLFYLTVKYEEFYSKEIEECWSALCSRWERNVSRVLDYLIVMAGLCGTPVLMHVSFLSVIYITLAYAQWAKSPKENRVKECVFVNSALKIQCQVRPRSPQIQRMRSIAWII